jgi:RecB family endonuclease NucS
MLELDVLGYNDEAACVVEIKSHLREDGVKQILDTLAKFPTFFPEHGGKRLYGMLAAVDIPESLKPRVKKAGLYLARVRNETFEFEELFPLARAKDFNPATKGQSRNGHR